MAKRLISLSGKVIRRSAAYLDSDRYNYLSLEQAEPNPGNPDSDNSLFFSNADGTRGFTKKPKLRGLAFDDQKLQDAGENRDYALILNTNPTIAGDDSVGYRQLGDLAFTNESELTLQTVTQSGNTTNQGIILEELSDTLATSALSIQAFNALNISQNTQSTLSGQTTFDATSNTYLDGNIYAAGATGLLSIKLLVLGDNDSVGSRDFNFTNFTAPTLQQVVEESITSNDQGSGIADGATTSYGIRPQFIKFNSLPPQRSNFVTHRNALVIEGVNDSIGYRSLKDLALYDSTTSRIRFGQIDVTNPTQGTLPLTGTVPMVKWNQSTLEYDVVQIEVTNLDDTFETLHSVSGRKEEFYDTGETGNEVIFSNSVKLRGIDGAQNFPLAPVISSRVFVANSTGGNTDSAFLATRIATPITWDDTLINLDYVIDRGDSTSRHVKFSGPFEFGNRTNVTGTEPTILGLNAPGDSVVAVTLNTIAFTGAETDTLDDVVSRGNSTDLTPTFGGIDISSATGIGVQIDSAVLEATVSVNRFVVYDKSSGTGKLLLRELDNNVLDGEDDTLLSVTTRGDSTNLSITTNGLFARGPIIGTDTVTAATLNVEDLTTDRLVVVGADGELEDDANLTYDGTKLLIGVGLEVTGLADFDSTRIDASVGGFQIVNLPVTTEATALTIGTDNKVVSTEVVTITSDQLITGIKTFNNQTFLNGDVFSTGVTQLDSTNIQKALVVGARTSLESASIAAGLNLTNLKGAESLDVLTVDVLGEVQQRSLQSTAFTGETLTSVTDPTRPAGYDITTTPLYLNGGISLTAGLSETLSNYNLLVITNSGDSVEYITVDADILDGSGLTLDDVLGNGNLSSRSIILQGSGGISADSATLSSALTVDGITLLDSTTVRKELVVLGNLRVEGTTTVINSTELSVEDLSIEVANNAAQASDANGGGFFVNLGVDGQARLRYEYPEDQFGFNKSVYVNSDLTVSNDFNVLGSTLLDSTTIDAGTDGSGIILQNLAAQNNEFTIVTIDLDGTIGTREATTSAFTDPNLQVVTDEGNTTTNDIRTSKGIWADSAQITTHLTVGQSAVLNGGLKLTTANTTASANDNIEILSLTAGDSVENRTLGNLLDIVTLSYVTNHGATTTDAVTLSGGLTLENLTSEADLLTVYAKGVASADTVVETTLETTAHTPLTFFTLNKAAETGTDTLSRRISVTNSIDLDGGFTANLTNPLTPPGSFDVIRLVEPGSADSAFRVTLQSGATTAAEDYTWAFVLENGDSTGGQVVNINDGLYIDRTQLPNNSPYDISLVVPVFNPTGGLDQIGHRTLGTAANLAQGDIDLQFVTTQGQTTIGSTQWSQTTNNLKIGSLIVNGLDDWTSETNRYTGTEQALFRGPADSVGYRDLGAFAFKDVTSLQEVTNFGDASTFSGTGDSTDAWLKMSGLSVLNGSQFYLLNSPVVTTANASLMWDSATGRIGRAVLTADFISADLQAVTTVGDSTSKKIVAGGGLVLPPGKTTILDGATANLLEPSQSNYYQMLVINTDTDSVSRGNIGVIANIVSDETLKSVTNRGASLTGSGIDSTNENVAFSGDFYLSALVDETKDALLAIDTVTGKVSTRSVEDVANTSSLHDAVIQGNRTNQDIAAKGLYLLNTVSAFNDQNGGFDGNYTQVLDVQDDVAGTTLLTIDNARIADSASVGTKLLVKERLQIHRAHGVGGTPVSIKTDGPSILFDHYTAGGTDSATYQWGGNATRFSLISDTPTTNPSYAIWYERSAERMGFANDYVIFPPSGTFQSQSRVLIDWSGVLGDSALKMQRGMGLAVDGISRLNNTEVAGTAQFSAPVSIQNFDATNELSFTGTEFTNVLSETNSGFNFGTSGSAPLTLFTANAARMVINEVGGTTFNDSVTIAGADANLYVGQDLYLRQSSSGSGDNSGTIHFGAHLQPSPVGSITVQDRGAILETARMGFWTGDPLGGTPEAERFYIADGGNVQFNHSVDVTDNLDVHGFGTFHSQSLYLNHTPTTGVAGIYVKTPQKSTGAGSHFIAFDSAGIGYSELRLGVKQITSGSVVDGLTISGQDGMKFGNDHSSTDFAILNRTTSSATATKLLFSGGNSVSADAEQPYGEIRTVFTSRTDGDETARMEFRTIGLSDTLGNPGRRIVIDADVAVEIEDVDKLQLKTGVQFQDAAGLNLVIYDSAGAVLWGNV